MTTLYRGFNIDGPYTDNPNYSPNGIHNYDVYDVAQLAGSLNANIVRVVFSWYDYEPTQGSFNLSMIQHVKDIVNRGRISNPNLKALLMIDWIPDWVPGNVPMVGDPHDRGRYVSTQQGYSAFGQMLVKVLKELAGFVNYVEISNEPNGLPQNHGTNIPAVHYGAMCAYAAFWMDTCLQPPTYERAYPLGGALWTDYNQNWKVYLNNFMTEFYTVCNSLYPYSTSPLDFVRLTQSLRLSTHPYPWLQEPHSTFALHVSNSKVSWLHSNYPSHKIWITEVGGSSVTLGTHGQDAYVHGMCYVVCGPKPRVEGLLFWPTTDAEGYAWDSASGFYRFGVVAENGEDVKVSGLTLTAAFADPDWTTP